MKKTIHENYRVVVIPNDPWPISDLTQEKTHELFLLATSQLVEEIRKHCCFRLISIKYDSKTEEVE